MEPEGEPELRYESTQDGWTICRQGQFVQSTTVGPASIPTGGGIDPDSFDRTTTRGGLRFPDERMIRLGPLVTIGTPDGTFYPRGWCDRLYPWQIEIVFVARRGVSLFEVPRGV